MLHIIDIYTDAARPKPPQQLFKDVIFALYKIVFEALERVLLRRLRPLHSDQTQ